MIKIKSSYDDDGVGVTIRLEGDGEKLGYEAVAIITQLIADLHENVPESDKIMNGFVKFAQKHGSPAGKEGGELQ